jgi:hypothetical protein
MGYQESREPQVNMAKMRPPKDIERFGPAAEVAEQLVAIADLVRSKRGKVAFSVKLRFWNDDWVNPDVPKPEFIVTGTELRNKEQRFAGL